ncbi:MAG TPA: hypothetical protein VN611_14875 [Patescibacteria group bacterium]|nr:hypothetical protein [Patescibacteria group bacterium]
MASVSSVSGGFGTSILQGMQQAIQQMRENQQKRQEKLDELNSLPQSNTLTNKPAGASLLDLPTPNTMGGQYQPPSKSMMPPPPKVSNPSEANEAVLRLRDTMAAAIQTAGLALYQQTQSVSSFLSGESAGPKVNLQS